MMLNKTKLSGIDNIQDLPAALWVCLSFWRNEKNQSIKKDYIYLPITDHIRKFIKSSIVNGEFSN